MIVRVQLLARLLGIRLLRVEGVVAISDGDLPSVDPSPGAPVVHLRVDRDVPALGAGRRRPSAAVGHDLAEAEALLAQMPATGGAGTGRRR